MNYSKLEPIEHESGILRRDGIHFHSPSDFAKEHLYYPHFGGVYTCTFPYRVKRDYCNAFLLARILDGELHVSFLDRYFCAGAGTVVFLDCKHRHAYWAEEPVTFQWIHFDGCSTQAYFDLLVPEHGICFPDKPELFFQFQYLIDELKTDAGNDHRLSSLIHNILGLLAIPDKEKEPAAITEALRYLSLHFREPITVDVIASHIGLNPQYFSRLFKKHLHQAPHQYLNTLRLRRAKSLLIESDFTIQRIAEECGFSGSTHFIRVFKQENRITPQMFRKYFDPAGFRD